MHDATNEITNMADPKMQEETSGNLSTNLAVTIHNMLRICLFRRTASGAYTSSTQSFKVLKARVWLQQRMYFGKKALPILLILEMFCRTTREGLFPEKEAIP